MRDAGTELHDLAAHLDVRDDPELAGRVAAQIDALALRSPATKRRVRRAVLAAVAVVVAAASATAAPAVAGWLRERVGGVEIRRDRAPAPTPSPAPSATSGFDLGRRTTLADAERAAPFPVKTLAGPDPGEVWLDEAGGITVVSLVYPDVLLQQFAAPLADRATMTKVVGAETVVDEVDVEGARGLWIEGAHAIALRTDGTGAGEEGVTFVPSRRAGNTLVWEANGVTYRFECALDRAAALARAATLR